MNKKQLRAYLAQNTDAEKEQYPACPYFVNGSRDAPDQTYGCGVCCLYTAQEDPDFPPHCESLLITNSKGFCDYAAMNKNWYEIRHKDVNDLVWSVFRCEAASEKEALAQLDEQQDETDDQVGTELGEITVHDLEPYSHWIPKAPGAKYPKDAICLSSAIDGKVEISSVGGGMVKSGPIEKFTEHYKLVTQEMKDAKQPELAFFGFDDPPYVLGFTYGYRWNGWGEPLLEEESLRKFWAATTGMGDHEYFRFDDEGVLLHFEYPDGDPENESYVIEPHIIEYEGKEYRTYNVGCGMCWNQTDVDNTAGVYNSDEIEEMRKAITPDGLDANDYLPREAEHEIN